jgi:class 3 adenylate cyclase
LDEHGGIVITMSGTTLLALWSPLLGDSDHARRALEAGNRLVEQLDSDRIIRRRARASVAVHTGLATVELIGNTPRSHRLDVSGDALETVEHLAAGARGNQLRASPATLAAAGPN